jgi:ribosomal protein S10
MSNNSRTIQITLRSFCSKFIDTAAISMVRSFEKAGFEVKGPIPIPNKSVTTVIPRAPNGDGKTSHFKVVVVTHKRVILIPENKNPGLIEYIKLQNVGYLPDGVFMAIKIA